MKDLVLLGGGHSHVEVLRQFGLAPPPDTRITFIGRERHTPYSGMLPGHIAGHYSFDQMHIDLERLTKFARVNHAQDEATGVDTRAQRVLCRGGQRIPYDILSINTGITPSLDDVPGARGQVIPVKPISQFLQRWALLRQRVQAATGAARIGVVGGGAGGVEILLAVQHSLAQLPEIRAGRVQPEYFLISAGELLATHNARVRSRFARVLARRGVRVFTGRAVSEVIAGALHFADGETLALDEILWVTQAAAAGWIAESGLGVDTRGFLQVNAALQSLSHPGVFAAGDVAAVVNHPREKAGVFAVRQGPPLTANLRLALAGKPPRPFTPQRRFLSLISTGNTNAVASYGGWSAEGRWVWRWKDHIDRSFMARYHRLYTA
jgi:selenide,water dikinase